MVSKNISASNSQCPDSDGKSGEVENCGLARNRPLDSQERSAEETGNSLLGPSNSPTDPGTNTSKSTPTSNVTFGTGSPAAPAALGSSSAIAPMEGGHCTSNETPGSAKSPANGSVSSAVIHVCLRVLVMILGGNQSDPGAAASYC
ncbi:hypothetical protein C8R46DRAFT_1210433 [Mycena filopes]|nr:hypothetical protein C8R46DRAFT_1210433 [Mycena filopes]